MKKYSLAFFAVLFFSIFSIAQNKTLDSLNALHYKKHNWRFSISTGYGLPIGGSVLGNENYVDDQTANRIYVKQIKGTYGTGSWSFAEAIYMVRPHFGFLVGGYYFFGRAQRNSYLEDLKVGFFAHDLSEVSIQSPGSQLGFIFSDTLRHKFILTCQSALLTGIGNQALLYHYADNSNPAYNSNQKIVEYGGLSLGWVNRAGISFRFHERWETGIEGFAVIESWGPKKGKIISSVLGGVDQLDSMSSDERKYVLVNTVNYSSIGPPNSGQRLQVVYPFHAAGMLLHISYRL